MNIKLISEINSFKNSKLYLPNSVSILKNNSIIVADGGNDRICIFDSAGKSLKSIGLKGLGKYRFKEPVGAFVSPKNKIFVMDWHNHRVVIFNDKLKYLNEFGHFSNQDKFGFLSNLKSLIIVLKKLFLNGTYIPYHFKKNKYSIKKYIFLYQIIISFIWFLRTFLYQIINYGYKNYFKNTFNKPNGICFSINHMVITQKKK